MKPLTPALTLALAPTLALLLAIPSAAQTVNGLGHSTLTCIDQDGDGYGVGPGCLGLDADDQDASVQTAAQGISKYGTLAAFIAHLGAVANTYAPGGGTALQSGYASPNHTWYLAPAGSGGSDSNNCASAGAPCLTISRLVTQGFVGGDLVIARQAWNGALSLQNGSSSKYTVFLSYPGEQAILTGAAGNAGDLTSASYVAIDGLKIANGSQVSGGTPDGTGSNAFNHVFLNHIDGGSGGTSIGAVDMFNGLSYFTVVNSIFHDNSCGGGSCQHGMYNGSRELASDHVVYQNLIAYNNDYNGLTFNGRCTSCSFGPIVAYANGIAGLTIEEGVSSSSFYDVLLFNNFKQFNIYDYAGQGYEDLGNGSATVNTSGTAVTWVSSADGGTFTSGAVPGGTGISINCQWYSVASVTDAHHLVLNQSAGTQTGVVYYQAPPICPYDQTGNTFENFTVYQPQFNPDGSANGYAVIIEDANPGAGKQHNLGGNTYRNWNIVSYGGNNLIPPINYNDCNATGDGVGCGSDGLVCAATCQGWLANDTWDHFVYYQSDSNHGTGFAGICTTAPVSSNCTTAGSYVRTPAQLNSLFSTTITAATNADPKFVSASPSFYNTPASYNLRLASGSPAIHSGTATGAPVYDLVGNPFSATPSIGAYEFLGMTFGSGMSMAAGIQVK